MGWTLQASADDFLQNSGNYSAMVVGVDKVQFTLPTQYDGNLNEGVSDGRIQITYDGVTRSFLDWKVPNYRDLTSDSESGKCEIKAYIDGTFQLTGKVRGGTKTFGSSTCTYTLNYNDDDDDHFTTTVVWTAPRSLRGKKLKFECWAKSEDRDWTWYMPSKDGWKELLTWDCPPAPEVSVRLGDAMLSFETDHVNEQMFTYSINARSVSWAKLHYTDSITKATYTQDLPKDNLVGMVYIPANRPWCNVYIDAHVYDGEGKEVKDDIRSESRTSNMLHYPTDLYAVVNNKGQAELTWVVENSDWEDMLNGDFFEIQRNVTGSGARIDPGWVTISASIPYEQGKRRYTFTDETLLNQYTGDTVSYRIRRAYTSMWQWADHSGSSEWQVGSLLTLPSLASATVSRTSAWNDDGHVAQFTFTLQHASGKQDQQGRYTLNNEIDFQAFAQLVNSGQTNISAVMTSNIDISTIADMIGDSEQHPFKGTFDGNGYALTVNYNTTTPNTGPIRFASGATVKNLRVMGRLASSAKFVGGIISRSYSGTNTISNCIVAAEIYSSINGDATNGGLVGVNGGGATLNITDCKFEGQFTGSYCHSNGGFVGWNDGDVNLTSCYTTRYHRTKFDNCDTFVRGSNADKIKITNCFYNYAYNTIQDINGNLKINGEAYRIINDKADWKRFQYDISYAKGNYAINAILNTDLYLTTDDMIGSDDIPYCGTFDGNGHTLEMNIDWGIWYTAPFRHVNKATFKNLKLRGWVTGASHPGGLIGLVMGESPVVHIENVFSGVAVKTSTNYAGGIIGDAGSATIYMEDVKSYGDIHGEKYSYIHAGALIGRGDRGAPWYFHRVYEYVGFTDISHPGFCWQEYNSTNYHWADGNNCTSCVSWHDWKEVLTEYRSQGPVSAVEIFNKEQSGSWTTTDQMPVMGYTAIPKGICYFNESSALSTLGSQWDLITGNGLYPKMTQNAIATGNASVWDKRARLLLRVNMHGEKGVEQMLIDLTDNEDAIERQTFTQTLTRKCVDYSFDLILRRGTSPLAILNPTDGNTIAADSLLISVKKTETGDAASYKFMNNNSVSNLKATTQQSSVELTWNSSGGDLDFYRILRRKHSSDDNARWTDTIATNLKGEYYEDKAVLAQQDYDYRVESIYQCEGTHVSTCTVSGARCEPTGMVDGYVRMADGTAMAGVTVECRPDAAVKGADALYTTVTDDTGYFVFRGLPYQGSGAYYVTIPTTGDQAPFTSPNAKGQVNFSSSSNWTQDFNFFLDTYYVYSGNVYYRNTSIPVPGVSFRLDGELMHDASGHAIITDTQGAFELSIPRGAHSVQAVKDGHRFANDGYLMNPDATTEATKTLYNFVQNVASVYLWDSTTVLLRGRVVGGEVEGLKPLSLSQSKNNLGDSLKIVMQLEGDNTSWLIRHQDDESIKSDSYTVTFGLAGTDTARVDVTRHTLTIRPDAKTGEYQLRVPPVKYKVTEVSAEGYATLFQQGKVGETIDLTFQKDGDTCQYSRIYHAVPTVEVRQFNAGNLPYFGTQKTTASDNIGNKDEMILWWPGTGEAATPAGVYAFGYPVFMAGSPYGWMLQACEKYYWNNRPTVVPDVVNLNGGTVSIKNLMVSSDATEQDETIELNDQGYGSYVFTPANVTTVLEGENALKSVAITLKYDDNYYDVYPLDGKLMRGYVMTTSPKSDGSYTIAASYPQLIDILRDPPGSGSSSYIEAGSKLSYSYSPSFEGTLGLSFSYQEGTTSTLYNGVVQISMTSGSGNTSGTISEAHSEKALAYSLSSTYHGSWVTSYTIDVNERIQTRTGQKWVGPNADLYMGTNEQLVLQDAIAVRVIPEKQYQLMKKHEGGSFEAKDESGNLHTIKVKVGTMRVLAQGRDDKGENVYLVRDEVMGVSQQVKSTFIHSQYYIEKDLLPQLIKMRNSLVLAKGSIDAAAAQNLANSTNKPVYVSTVETSSLYFGATDSVTVYYPKNDPKAVNMVNSLNQQLACWLKILAQNEQEKLNVQPSNLVKNYDIDGGMGSLQYGETFSATRNMSGYVLWPGLDNASVTKLIPEYARPIIEKILKEGSDAKLKDNVTNNSTEVDVATAASSYKVRLFPIVTFDFHDKSSEDKTRTKRTGFTLATSAKSSLNVDVYRTRNGKYAISEKDYQKNDTVYDEMLHMTAKVLDELRYGQPYHPDDNIDVYSNFVFRTRGGTTSQPYEGERRTTWYQPGTVIDAATVPIDKPNIWIDQPVVSNVPFSEPARFVVHMANESDLPDQATRGFMYYLESDCNPKGAKVCVDGKVINATDEPVWFVPVVDAKTGKHNVITKEITVYPSTAYDYEDLAISLYDPEDMARVSTAKFSAHFIPSAGKVNVSVPGDNWVMNTESPYDGRRQGYYLPVRIDGFDVNFPGFDHIELQYKLSTQGDKDWVSTCSYYHDKTLMQKASGVTDTIPANGIIVAPFYGEADPVEQYYDLRAVNYCRYAGGFLTQSSPILKGIKDTRLPELFGTPEPINGILGIGEDLKLTFSEPIAGNYLSKINNFELLGTPLSTDISTSTSLTFDGSLSFAYSSGQRNLSGKSFSVDVMLNPATDATDMTVFSHGGSESNMTFGLSADRHLTATINGETVQSDEAVRFNGILQQVVYTLDQQADGMAISFYDGSQAIGTKKIAGSYSNNTNFYIGNDFNDMSKPYKGDMLELRLWNHALTPSDISEYGRHTLTGYESGLQDYYPMNEGSGDYCYDKAPGSMDLRLVSTSWKRPDGLALKLDGKKGLRLKPDKFMRSKAHDYTLMFWFRKSGSNTTLFANGEATEESKAAGADNQLNIGFTDDDRLFVRSDGWQKIVSGYLINNEWHHFAMTVSRSRNVANIYLDQRKVDSFAADSLAGIAGDHVALGATYIDKNTPVNVLTGNIDEVGMFESVLPLQLISNFATHTPVGTMTAMMAYLNFEESVRQDDNTMRLEPTGVSLKQYRDNQGNILARRDTLVSDIDADMIDRTVYAPMVSASQLQNLNFSYVTNDNQLVVNIKEPDYAIEKTNVYLTVKEVPDLQGNLMASPVTMNVYVYRNPLRWGVKRISRTINYGEGLVMEVTVQNLSGQRQNYELDDLPVWISASQTSGVIDALGEETITFSVSPYINIGTYDEQITLLGEASMSEPLPVTLSVRGEEPAWAVSDKLKQAGLTMMMVARVKTDGIVASSEEDMLAVFDENLQTLGVTHIEVDNTANANEALAYLTIYGYTKDDGTKPTLSFRFFDASKGQVVSVKPADGTVYQFQKDATIGSVSNPVELVSTYNDMQALPLRKGWNWVSFTVLPIDFGSSAKMTVREFFDSNTCWEVGDIILTVEGSKTQQWTCRADKSESRGYKWDHADEPIDINQERMYSIYSMNDKTVYLEGFNFPMGVTVHKDWNRIAYQSDINLPIEQALSDYIEQAAEGDIVKSQDAFAVASRTTNGLTWKGSLKYLEAGKGYMIKRQADSNANFEYPQFYGNSRYSGNKAAPRRTGTVNTATTMNIVATVSGIDTEEGDRLVAYSGAERVAEATADDEQHYYLSIGEYDETLTFAIERDGELVAMTGSRIGYTANKVMGSPTEPTAISFVNLSEMPHDGKWYTTGGILLPKKPAKPGLYIHNGKARSVKAK